MYQQIEFSFCFSLFLGFCSQLPVASVSSGCPFFSVLFTDTLNNF
jgi:hypothetical protein